MDRGGTRARGLNFADSSEKYMESWLCARASVCAATYHKLQQRQGPGPEARGDEGRAATCATVMQRLHPGSMAAEEESQ